MIATLRLLPVLIRRAPRQAAGAIALCAVGVAVATLVAGSVIAAWSGLGDREARLVWREPSPAAEGEAPTALQRRSTDFFDGARIERVELAATGPGPDAMASVPVPPGLRAAPEPGTSWVSPALAELIDAHPSTELGARFGNIVGTIATSGLTRPDELVAVSGSAPGSLGDAAAVDAITPVERRVPGSPSAVVGITRFDTGATDRDLQLYRDLALVAVVLVSVPALMLVGSAARLTAARREQRMAAIRLAGATPGSVRALAAAETSIGAAIGAAVGVGASVLVAPMLDGVEIAGGRWFPDDLRLSPALAVGLTAGAVAICIVAALLSLRRVSTTPLGVSRSVEPQRARWPRVLGTVVAIVVLCVATAVSARGGSTLSMIAALGVVIGSLALVGPWITSLIGRAMVGAARRTPLLIAGRRIVEDPRSAYRIVSSVVLAGLIAGFLAGAMPSAEARIVDRDPSDVIALGITVADAPKLVAASDELRARFPGLQIDPAGALDGLIDDSSPEQLDPATQLVVHGVLGPAGSIDDLRTATDDLRGGQPLVGWSDDVFGDQAFVEDVQRASLVVLVAGLLLAAASSAVAAAAAVIDQRRTIARLALGGMPVAELQRARRWQSVLPLVGATAGAVGVGLVSAVLLMLGFGVRQDQIVGPQVAQLALVIVAAVVMGLGSASLTRPLLVAAARSATSS